MPRLSLVAPIAGATVFLTPAVAAAHTAFVALGSFWAGVLHPLTALDEVGVLLGLAAWAGPQPRRRDIGLVGAVLLGCFCGVIAASWWRGPFAGEGLTAVLMVVIGVAGALRLPIGGGALAIVALVGGSVLGGASAEGMKGVSLGLFAIGAAVASASVLSYALIAAARANAEWSRIALRAGASWIAAIGLMIAALESVQLFGRT